MATCPPYPKLNDVQRGSKAAEIAKAMGVQSCDTSTETFNANISGPSLGPIRSYDIDITFNKSSSIGCEPLIISADSYYKNQQSINCTLKKSSTIKTTTLRAGNKIILDAGRDFKTDCAEFVINQTINIQYVDTTKLSSTDVTEIANATKDVITSTANNILEQKMELGATPNGAKDVKDKLADIKQTDYNALINETLNEINCTVNANNDIIIRAGRDLILSGSRCSFSQDIVLDIISSTIITDSMTKVFESLTEITNTNDEDRRQIYDAKGLSDFIEKTKKKGIPTWIWYIVGAVGLIIAVILVKSLVGKKPEGESSMSSSTSSFRYY
jgi:hypothetical protein